MNELQHRWLFFALPSFVLNAVVQGVAHADGVLCSANVPRFAPPLFRCAEHTIDVSGSEHWLISANPERALVRLISGAPRSEIKEERSGGHSRRGVPGGLCTRPEQHRHIATINPVSKESSKWTVAASSNRAPHSPR